MMNPANGRMRAPCAALLSAALLLNACVSWHPLDGSVATNIEARTNEEMRVQLRDGKALQLHAVRIDSDSVTGTERLPLIARLGTPEERSRGYRERFVAIPIADGQSVSESRFSLLKTIGVIGVVAVVIVAAGAIAMSGQSMDIDLSGSAGTP